MIGEKIAKISTLLLSALFALNSDPSSAQSYSSSFTCSYGEQAACLDYGETVCSSQGKCVRDSAVCFDQYTCGYGYDNGFVCRSDLDECVEAHDDLVGNYNDLLREHDSLVDRFNSLLDEYQSLSERHDRLLETHEELLEELESLREQLRSLQ